MKFDHIFSGTDISEYSIRQRWRKRAPNVFPSPWSSAWGFDKYGLWQEFEFQAAKQKMRFISHGEFQMGSPVSEAGREDHETQHTVTLSQGFWLGEIPVSQALWKAVMDNNPSTAHASEDMENTVPVESVTWEECQEFCRLLGVALDSAKTKLPTEAQWEYACRGGMTTAFATRLPIGNAKRAVIDEPNPWGLKQMHGNVWEWCEDGLRQYTSGSLTDPEVTENANALQNPASTLRIIRGGSFHDQSNFQRSAARFGRPQNTRSSNLGFRLCIL